MTYYMLMTMTLISSMIFLQMNHPLAMGLMLLIQTMLVCLMSGMMSSTFWFSYILFLIFMGGMLVLFIYVTSLASNEMFSLSMKLTITALLMLTMILMLLFIMDKHMIYMFTENNEMKLMNLQNYYMIENTVNLSKLYNFPTNMITIMLINYLLITLVAAVKITNMFYGPLRQHNN